MICIPHRVGDVMACAELNYTFVAVYRGTNTPPRPQPLALYTHWGRGGQKERLPYDHQADIFLGNYHITGYFGDIKYFQFDLVHTSKSLIYKKKVYTNSSDSQKKVAPSNRAFQNLRKYDKLYVHITLF